MFANKKSVFIVMAYFLITFVSFPRLWAQGELKKTPLEKQKEESKQKHAPSFILGGAKIEVVPAKKAPEQQKSQSTQEKQVSTKNQAQISLDFTHYDAGEVWEGDEVFHTFTIKNTGTAQLNIKKVGAG